MVTANGSHNEPRKTEIAAALATSSRSSPSRAESTTAVNPMGADAPNAGNSRGGAFETKQLRQAKADEAAEHRSATPRS